MQTNIGITEKNRQVIVHHLSKLLADEYLLYTKTRNAHWNVEGPDFHDKHAFFDVQIGQLDAIIDGVAERIRTLGHYVTASMKMFLDTTHLTEKEMGKTDSSTYMKELLADHTSIILYLRGNIRSIADKYQDAGTADLISSLLEDHEKMAWFLRSHLN